jgi:bifunctional DNase/RNase
MVRVEPARLIVDERADEQVLFLREVDGKRELPIVLGSSEASLLGRVLQQRASERPLTHDLLVSVVRQLGGQVARAVIDDWRDDVYVAKLVVRSGREEVALDARPSDAIVTALKVDAPVYVAEKVMNAATA